MIFLIRRFEFIWKQQSKSSKIEKDIGLRQNVLLFFCTYVQSLNRFIYNRTVEVYAAYGVAATYGTEYVYG